VLDRASDDVLDLSSEFGGKGVRRFAHEIGLSDAREEFVEEATPVAKEDFGETPTDGGCCRPPSPGTGRMACVGCGATSGLMHRKKS
jgi:hypothetical protein